MPPHPSFGNAALGACRDCTQLFLGQLPFGASITEDEVLAAFSKYNCKRVKLIQNHYTGATAPAQFPSA